MDKRMHACTHKSEYLIYTEGKRLFIATDHPMHPSLPCVHPPALGVQEQPLPGRVVGPGASSVPRGVAAHPAGPAGPPGHPPHQAGPGFTRQPPAHPPPSPCGKQPGVSCVRNAAKKRPRCVVREVRRGVAHVLKHLALGGPFFLANKNRRSLPAGWPLRTGHPLEARHSNGGRPGLKRREGGTEGRGGRCPSIDSP